MVGSPRAYFTKAPRQNAVREKVLRVRVQETTSTVAIIVIMSIRNDPCLRPPCGTRFAPLPDFDLTLARSLLDRLHAVLVDVRTSAEQRATGHFRGATLIEAPGLPPLTRAQERELAERLRRAFGQLARTTPFVLYCKRGVRAAIAKRILRNELGFPFVTVVGGVDEEPLKSLIARGEPLARRACRPAPNQPSCEQRALTALLEKDDAWYPPLRCDGCFL